MEPIVVRGTLCVLLLGGGWLGQIALQRHVQSAGPLAEMPLLRPLSELPLELGDWEGEDRPVTDAKLLYADEHLQRVYHHRHRPQALSVWIVYSRHGEDRGHHPEVCMAVAGRPEDPTQRAALPIDGHAAPVQQYRFGGAGDWQWVFYWYYTLVPPKREVTEVQRLYQRLHRRPSSVTLEVFAPELSPDDGAQAREFVKLLDAAMGPHLGPAAVRGSERIPVTVIRTKEPD